MNSSVIDSLKENGYMAEYHVSGAGLVQIVGARQGYFYLNPGDFAADKRQFYRDPKVSVAVLEFTIDQESPLVSKWIAELVKVIAPADKFLKRYTRPLVRTTSTTLHAVYQTATHNVALRDHTIPYRPELFREGFAFPDVSAHSIGLLRASCGSTLIEGGTWLDDRSPLSVKREVLAQWNGEELAAKLQALVERAIEAGDMRELRPYREPVQQDWSHEALLARQGVELTYTEDDVIPPLEYADARLREAFGVDLGGSTSTGDGFSKRRRG